MDFQDSIRTILAEAGNLLIRFAQQIQNGELKSRDEGLECHFRGGYANLSYNLVI